MSSVPAFAFTSGNPDRLVGGQPAVMADIQGPFYDLRAYLNGQIVPTLNSLAPPAQTLISAPVLEVGLLNQIRAGRQLALADFTAAGLAAPNALWNLTDLSDASGNVRTLINKGAVGFATGINGIAGTAAQFNGLATQALYIPDTGLGDPFRITTGSWGCWLKCSRRGVSQTVLTKLSPAAGQYAWELDIASGGVAQIGSYSNGTVGASLLGVSDIMDDRWHFLVATHDGTMLRLYVDGALEALTAAAFPIFGGSGPLNIGGYGADGAAPALAPFFGRVDEAFVTGAVLTEDQIRFLYLAKIAHGYASVPTRVTLNVRRRRRGSALVVADFPTTPLRLYNFTNESTGDQGSSGIALGMVGTAPTPVAGADGAPSGAFSLGGAGSFAATDAGLPAGTASRSYGCWFKAGASSPAASMIAWGTAAGFVRLILISGVLRCDNTADLATGPFAGDGQWHLAVVTEDNAAADGAKRKLYMDGRLVATSTVLNAVTSAGASGFKVGNDHGGNAYVGQIDGVFVHSAALTFEQIAALYAKGSQALLAAPKNAGDHIDGLDATNVYATFDTLDSTALIDLGVTA